MLCFRSFNEFNKFLKLKTRHYLHLTVLQTAAAIAALSLSCVNEGDYGSGEHGMVEIRARMVNRQLGKALTAYGANDTKQTVAEKLVLEFSGGGLALTRIERKLDFSRPTIIDTVTKVPAGKNVRVTVWAINKSGATTHIDSLESHTITIGNAEVTPIIATLIPAAGSIYLQFLGLSTAIDSVKASFTSINGDLIADNGVKRAAKTEISLDDIPHLTEGILKTFILAKGGDTVYISTKELTFDARGDNHIDLQFIEYGGAVTIDAALYAPGVTIGSYNFGNSESTVTETGELIITEIMWSANNDNYIELHNPSNLSLFFDTLTTDIDGTTRHYANVSVAALGYLVIGRRNMPHVDIFPPTSAGLPIAATGNWITVKRKDGSIIDRVICSGSNGALGWPVVSGKKSIELMKDKYSAVSNNYGKNWTVTTGSLIGTGTFATGIPAEQYGAGTPGY